MWPRDLGFTFIVESGFLEFQVRNILTYYFNMSTIIGKNDGCSYVTSYYSLVVSCKYVLSFIPDHKIFQEQVISFLFPIERY